MASLISFQDKETLERVVELFYEDPRLKDYEIDSSDGITLLVSPEALPRLRELEINFEHHQ